jgi:hypothetical protein
MERFSMGHEGEGESRMEQGPGLRRLVACVSIACLLFSTASGFAQQKKSDPKKAETFESLEYDNVFFTKKRDPVFAGMLSWYIPGLGQYYSERYFKGTFFLITEYALLLGGLFYFLNVDFAVGGDSGFNLKVDVERTDLGVVETSSRNVFYAVLGIVAVMHLYNISDAVMSARSFNRGLDRERKKLKKKFPGLELSYDGGKNFYIGAKSAL